MEPPPRPVAKCHPLDLAINLAAEAQRLAESLVSARKGALQEALVAQVEALSQQILPKTDNPGVASACLELSKALPKKQKALKKKLSPFPWTFLKELTGIILNCVDRPFTCMRVCRAWRTVALKSIVKHIETFVPPGYFGSIDKSKDLALQLLGFRKKVFHFFPEGLPIDKSKLNRRNTLSLLACCIINRNLIALAKQNDDSQLPTSTKSSTASLEKRAIEENLTPALVPLREYLTKVSYISLHSLEMIPPELVSCTRLHVESDRLQTLEHFPLTVFDLRIKCNTLHKILVTLPPLHSLRELSLTSTSLPDGLSLLTSLRTLQVTREQCTEKSRSYPKLKGLEQLKTLRNLTYLQFLELAVKIKKEALTHLTALETFKLGLCQLSFSECLLPNNLAEVAIWHCQIKAFTVSIPDQNRLRILAISTFQQAWKPPRPLLTRVRALPNLVFTYESIDDVWE